MIVYIVRISDSNAHEGDDGVAGVFFSEETAEQYSIDCTISAKTSRWTCSYNYYVQKWEVE